MKENTEITESSDSKKVDQKIYKDEEDGRDYSLTTYLTQGISSEEIQALQIAKSCSTFFPLFKELVRNQITEFWVKMAVLVVFAHDQNKTTWTPQEINNELFWLQETPRKRAITQLSRSNWLQFTNGNYSLSTFGRSILSVLTSLAHQEDVPDALGANISSLTLLEMYQNDPTNTLRMFLNELMRIDEEIQQALESKSEYIVRKLNRRVRSQFAIAIKSREHLQNLPTDNFHAYRLKQQIHEHLSSFHARLSQVQRIQNDLIARRIILADKSLNQHDINAFLINSSVEELAKLGRASTSYPMRILDMVPPLMVYETEWQLEKEHSSKERRGWTPMETASEGNDNLVTESRFFNFVGEVEHNLNHREEFTLQEFVPRENWTTSAFRFTMLSVMESGELPTHIQTANEVASPKITITPEQDAVQLPSQALDDHFSGVKEITKGTVRKSPALPEIK